MSDTRRTEQTHSHARPRLAGPVVIGEDPRMTNVLQLVRAVADARSTVLITGESGTGKSLIARVIHAQSPRQAGPFVEVACGAMPDTLLESELFGHVRGAFTGASADKEGKFAAADGGTIFLDEIATASPQLQVKLLRVLQERQLEPVGSNDTRAVDVRVILATHHDLAVDVQTGTFRRDLYYRVNVINIELPPLRERPADVAVLAEHMLGRIAAENNRPAMGFSPAAMERLRAYHWPGNVRELENAVEHAVVLCRRLFVEVDDLPSAVLTGGVEPAPNAALSPGQSLKEALREPQRQIILQALAECGGNRRQAAIRLGINRATLYKKMRRLGIAASSRDAQ
jgi:DNA-binding NtrC family response regulator